jgi:hypothetical protein
MIKKNIGHKHLFFSNHLKSTKIKHSSFGKGDCKTRNETETKRDTTETKQDKAETKRNQTKTRDVCITKYARLYKLSNDIMVMTPK